MHLLSGALIDLDGTIFVQLALFFVAFFVLKTLVFRPLTDVFDAREKAIDGSKVEARSMEHEAREKAATYDEELRKVRLAAAEERERLRQDGLRLERSLLEKVQASTQKELEEAGKRLDAEGRRVRGEIEKSVPVLARQIASKLLGREVTG